MKPNHETIYLVPTDYDGGQLTYSWCDCPAPGEGMDPEDAIKYVRADLVPASNEVLARRIVELTSERDAALAQVEQLKQDIAIGAKDYCGLMERHDALFVQFEKLREDSLVAFGDGFYDGYLHYAKLCDDLEFTDDVMRQSELAEAESIYGKRVGSSVRVAEIKASAIEDFADELVEFHNVHPYSKSVVFAKELANKTRQQAKGE